MLSPLARSFCHTTRPHRLAFVKKDGTERTMVCRRTTAEEETRRPRLRALGLCWVVLCPGDENYKPGETLYRTVNLETLTDCQPL